MLPPTSPSISQGPAPAPSSPPGFMAEDSNPANAGGAKNSLTLDPNLMSKAKGAQECKPGDTYKVNLTVRANSSGGFDVVDTEPLQKADSATGLDYGDDGGAVEPGSDAEEKLLGYRRPKKTAPQLG